MRVYLLNPSLLFFKSAEERAVSTPPEALHVLKAGFPKPFELIV